MEKSYIKSFTEPWYDYQLKFIELGIGGNKPFFDFIKEYKQENEPIKTKYTGRVAQYYSKRLRARIDGIPFSVPPPGKDW